MELITLRMLRSYAVSFTQTELYHYHYFMDNVYIIEERINGEQLLNNISILTSELKFSLGFKIAIEKRVGKVCIIILLLYSSYSEEDGHTEF